MFRESLMKLPLSFICLFSGTILFCACNKEKDASETAQLSLAPEQIKIKEAWNASSDWVKQITLSDTLIIRNTQWGLDLSRIQEKIELSESQPAQGKSYSLYFDDSDLNFVDIAYIPDNQGKLSGINLDIYVEDITEVGKLRNNLTAYFDAKFGPSVIQGKQTRWNLNKNTQVDLEDVSTSKDPGIHVILKAKP